MAHTFVIHYRPGPAWLAGQAVSAQPLARHLAYVMGLRETGQLMMGGPFSDNTGGMLVVNVDDAVQAQELLANDPGVLDGVLVAEAHPWHVLVQPRT